MDRNLKHALSGLAAGLAILLALGILFHVLTGDNSAQRQSITYTYYPRTPALDHAVYPGDLALAIKMAERSPAVLEASVHLDASVYTLTLVVGYAVTEDIFRQAAHDFVHMVKELGPDVPPGPEVGTGRYNYVIDVYRPHHELIAVGTKASDETHISWR